MINVLLINHKTRNRLDIDDSIKVKRGSKDFQSQVKNTRNVVLASQISNFHKIGNWKHFQLEKKIKHMVWSHMGTSAPHFVKHALFRGSPIGLSLFSCVPSQVHRVPSWCPVSIVSRHRPTSHFHSRLLVPLFC